MLSLIKLVIKIQKNRVNQTKTCKQNKNKNRDGEYIEKSFVTVVERESVAAQVRSCADSDQERQESVRHTDRRLLDAAHRGGLLEQESTLQCARVGVALDWHDVASAHSRGTYI